MIIWKTSKTAAQSSVIPDFETHCKTGNMAAGCDDAGCDGAGCDGAGDDGAGDDGTGYDGSGCDGAGCDGTCPCPSPWEEEGSVFKSVWMT